VRNKPGLQLTKKAPDSNIQNRSSSIWRGVLVI
jgi:hypothetical protein